MHMQLSLLTPENWNDYELIDSGDGRKLERFGNHTIARPEPQALWSPSLTAEQWQKMADAVFLKTGDSQDKGQWKLKNGVAEQWTVGYQYGAMQLKMRLGLTSFKHVGIFPEQAANWDFIYDSCCKLGPGAKVLNLFAYTGGASLAARAAGADVTHVDSVKQTVSWSRENMELSGQSDVRWVVEDALKFVNRQARRGAKYNGIILDPPSYGRGANGEKWVLEDNILEMLTLCSELLEDENSFLVLNLYSMGLSALLSHTLVEQLFAGYSTASERELGELYVRDRAGKCLPLGVFLRFANISR